MKKRLIPAIYLTKGQAVKGFHEKDSFHDINPVISAKFFSDSGADEIIIFDLSITEEEHEKAIGIIKEIARNIEIPLICGGNIQRVEDVKKLLYAGAGRVFLNAAKESNLEMLEEVSKRFGKDKVSICLIEKQEIKGREKLIEEYAEELILLTEIKPPVSLPVLQVCEKLKDEEVISTLQKDYIRGISCFSISTPSSDFMKLKKVLKSKGIEIELYENEILYKELKLNSDGMIPVIVQDYKTEEVLMLAYMNEEAFQKTIDTGKMTYWSRSRDELWTKGETSGHIQYVKSLKADCDNDTILARVSQVGPACHTGNTSCFFKTIIDKETSVQNPHKVLEDVYQVIAGRKEHPKEGSYTNYLFDKGIDKILKKVGEEAAEILIAAKNPDPEEIKYEISDFLYHTMVLMVEKGVSWEEIMQELSAR
jgi:phosphoribosyl-ATP pyrophosphohydrolase/phosphoribosyl-AMP cyclohydrolase